MPTNEQIIAQCKNALYGLKLKYGDDKVAHPFGVGGDKTLAAIERICITSYSNENINFLKAANSLLESSKKDFPTKLEHLYNTYLNPESLTEINIPGLQFEIFKTAYKNRANGMEALIYDGNKNILAETITTIARLIMSDTLRTVDSAALPDNFDRVANLQKLDEFSKLDPTKINYGKLIELRGKDTLDKDFDGLKKEAEKIIDKSLPLLNKVDEKSIKKLSLLDEEAKALNSKIDMFKIATAVKAPKYTDPPSIKTPANSPVSLATIDLGSPPPTTKRKVTIIRSTLPPLVLDTPPKENKENIVLDTPPKENKENIVEGNNQNTPSYKK